MKKRIPTPTAYKWASRVIIKFLNSKYFHYKSLIVSHLREDITLSAPTQFQSLIDMTPLGGVISKLESGMAFVGKGLGGVGKFQQTQVWKSTEPLGINFTLHFDTKTNSFENVVKPVFALLGYTLPEEQGGLLYTPGANIQSLIEQKKEAITKDKELAPQASDDDRLISLLVGGWCYIKRAVLTKAEPTFSKEITELGYPLWGEVMCEVKMLETATVQNIIGTKIAEDRTVDGMLGDARDITKEALMIKTKAEIAKTEESISM